MTGLLVDDTPVENILPAMRKFLPMFMILMMLWIPHLALIIVGYSWDEIAWALEPAVDKWALRDW